MKICCLDLEGVLVPELWVAVSKAYDVPALMRTTRDEPDYYKLMALRLNALKENHLGYNEIMAVINEVDPMPGAKAFLDELRTLSNVVIISDTYIEFTPPILKKLGYPTIFCNSLDIAPDGEITGHHLRVENSKVSTVRGLQSIGFETIAAGDSYNDLGMIRESSAGFLFRTTDAIRAANPDIPAYETYGDFLAAFKRAL